LASATLPPSGWVGEVDCGAGPAAKALAAMANDISGSRRGRKFMGQILGESPSASDSR
jgi:hypothetical protein